MPRLGHPCRQQLCRTSAAQHPRQPALKGGVRLAAVEPASVAVAGDFAASCCRSSRGWCVAPHPETPETLKPGASQELFNDPPRTNIYVGDQSDREGWARFRKQMADKGVSFDVILDDGELELRGCPDPVSLQQGWPGCTPAAVATSHVVYARLASVRAWVLCLPHYSSYDKHQIRIVAGGHTMEQQVGA